MELLQQRVVEAPSGRWTRNLKESHPGEAALVDRLLVTARRGLASAYAPGDQHFSQTVRAVGTDGGVEARPQGRNIRYAAMAALGLSRAALGEQRQVLSGSRASEVARRAATRAETTDDPGAVALAAWAMAEVNHHHPRRLLERLGRRIRSGVPMATVDLSWAITALAAVRLEGTGDLFDIAVHRLLGAQGAHGIFPHVLPARTQSSWRAHVGSFADQVYPVQALARGHAVTGDDALLEAANRTATRLCELQGSAGQWWWHYDTRTGGVVERYPVYSVHQHAMAPMVLGDLAAAGGDDHLAEVAAGLRWLQSPPETAEEMVSERFGLVWRKVGRREPRKAARAARAASTWLAPRREIPGLDRVLPPGAVDHECRPYELGWLLYAWLPRGEQDA